MMSTDVHEQTAVVLDPRIAIDDVGTGYSSLAYLMQLSVTTVKLDRAFMAQASAGNPLGFLSLLFHALPPVCVLH